MIWLQWLATLLGLGGVWLTARQSLLGWPVGLLWAALMAGVYYQARDYSLTSLHLIYCATSVYGWWSWRPGTARVLAVSRLSGPQILAGLLLGALASAPLAFLVSRAPDAHAVLADAGLTAYSLVAQLWMAHKRVQCWILWIVVDTGCAALSAYQQMWPAALMYLVFLALAWEGYRLWSSELNQLAVAAGVRSSSIGQV